MNKLIDKLLRVIMLYTGTAAPATALVLTVARRMKKDLTEFQQHRMDMLPGILAVLVTAFLISYGIREFRKQKADDPGGAEDLTGRGDMLLKESGRGAPVKIQGISLSDEEVTDLVDRISGRIFDGSETEC